MYTHQEEKQCGKHTFHSINCMNKIRKVSHNKFEIVTLVGKYAFGYKVIIQPKSNPEKNTKIIGFPNREQAIAFFTLTIKKYN